MTDNAIVNFMLLGAAFLAFCHVLYVWMKELIVAQYRADLFGLRRRLFRLVAEGRVAPNERAYVRLRHTLNGLLRTAEDMTFGSVVLMAVLARDLNQDVLRQTVDLIRASDDADVRRELHRIHDEISGVIGRHLRRSIWPSTLLPIIGVVILQHRVQHLIVRSVHAHGTVMPDASAA